MREAHVDGIRRAYFVGFAGCSSVALPRSRRSATSWPGLFTLWMMLHGGVLSNRMLAVLIAIAAGAAAYNLILREFLIVNYLVAVVTYSTIIPIVVIDSRWLASRALLEKLIAVMAPMILVQDTIGIVQAVYGAMQSGTFSGSNGDHVTGTIYPHLDAENAFSNPMFAANMVLMLLVYLSLPGAIDGRRRKSLVVGAIALMLASVVHVLVFLVAAIVGAVIFLREERSAAERATGS